MTILGTITSLDDGVCEGSLLFMYQKCNKRTREEDSKISLYETSHFGKRRDGNIPFDDFATQAHHESSPFHIPFFCSARVEAIATALQAHH